MSEDEKKSTLRALLEEGPVDPRIMAQLDLLEALKAAVARKDTKALHELGQKLRNNAQEIQAADAARRAAMDSAVEKAKGLSDPNERTAKLLEAFEFCAKTRRIAFDEAADKDSGDAATTHLAEIAGTLDTIPPGRRSALLPFLESDNRGVQVAAAVALLKIAPDRVIPILKEIMDKDQGSAGWSAFWALPRDWNNPPPTAPKGDAGES